MKTTLEQTKLTVEFRVWPKDDTPRIRCLVRGKWVVVSHLEEARRLAAKEGYDGIRVVAT